MRQKVLQPAPVSPTFAYPMAVRISGVRPEHTDCCLQTPIFSMAEVTTKPVKAKSSPRTCVVCGNIPTGSVYYTASSSILQKLQHILNNGIPQPPAQLSLQLPVADSDKKRYICRKCHRTFEQIESSEAKTKRLYTAVRNSFLSRTRCHTEQETEAAETQCKRRITSPSAGVKKTRPAKVTPQTTHNKTPVKILPKQLQNIPICTSLLITSCMKQGKPALHMLHRTAKKPLALLQKTENKEVRGPLFIKFWLFYDYFFFHLIIKINRYLSSAEYRVSQCAWHKNNFSRRNTVKLLSSDHFGQGWK